MAFRITQCPSCDSTFNTSPQMLEMAAGKVRCGACLSVFQAQENFVDADTDSHADEADESVFIGNDPEDFFDPTVFLTRSALQDDQASSGQPDMLSAAAEANPDFLADSDIELRERLEPVMPELDSEIPQDNDTIISAAQTIAAGAASNPMDSMADALAEGTEPSASSESLMPAADSESPQPHSDPAATLSAHLADGAAEEPIRESPTWPETNAEIEAEIQVGVDPEHEAKAQTEADIDSQVSAEIGTETEAEHADFFAALEESLDGLDATDELVELKAIAELDALGSTSETVTPAHFDDSTGLQTPTDPETESSLEEDPAEQAAADSQAPDDSVGGQDVPKESPLIPKPESVAPASVQRPEDVSLSISFSVQPRPTVLSAETAAAAAAEMSDQADQVEQLKTNRDRSTSDSSPAHQDSQATIEIEPEAGTDHSKASEELASVDNDSVDNDPLDELPSEIGELSAEPAFNEPELDPATEFSDKTVILESDTIRAAELAEQDFNEAIKEQEFADTVASGFPTEESMDSEPDGSLDWQLASVEDLSDDPDTIQSEDNGQNQETKTQLESKRIQSPEHDSPITEATKPNDATVIETPAFIGGGENEAGESGGIEASPETERDHPTEQATAVSGTHGEQAEARDSASESESEPGTEVSSEDIRARAMRTQLQDDEALEQLPEENLAALKVMATPLELGSAQGRRWGASLGLALIACLLGVGIAAQYLWRHNTVLSQQPMLRPLFATTCQLLGCRLEPYRNLSAIVSSNLSVRSHPERADAIMVNVEMRNTAPFEQPFPIMVLGFNTASNDLVALREFRPDEYLATGLQDITQMPVMAPVQIDLALMDPGDDAVNYTLAFRQP